jgi:hypothetical protein
VCLEKISDGIDHTALEGLVNLCDQEDRFDGEEEEKDNDASHEVDEDGKYY